MARKILREAACIALCAGTFASLSAGCADRTPQLQAEDAQQQAEFAQRKPGTTRLATLAEVAPELGCGTSRARMARLDRAEVLPVRATPGREIDHRYVYSACDAGATPITGTLIRRLVFARRTVFEERVRTTLRPGRWAVDVFVGIPPDAEPGWYGLEITFEHPQWPLYNWQYFQVVPKSAPKQGG